MKELIGIVVVSYKNPALTETFVINELSKINGNYRLVIVNVASTELESRDLAKRCQSCYAGEGLSNIYSEEKNVIIWSAENLEYAKGNDFGVEYLKKAHPDCSYYLFSNDDIIIVDSNVLDVLIAKANHNCTIAGIGPRVICLDGAEGSPQREYFSLLHIVGEHFFSCLRSQRQSNLSGNPSVNAPDECRADWISGALMLVKADWFNKVNGFDDRTFLYYEEPILAERFAKYGGYFYYVPDVCVKHLEGASSKRNRRKKEIIEQSRKIYYQYYTEEKR